MRLLKKGGSTPCDRRLDRRKVALAAVTAALFLSATATRVIADTYSILPTSNLKMTVTLIDFPSKFLFLTTPTVLDPVASFGDGLQFLPTPTGNSDSAFLSGTIDATVVPGVSITLNSGSSIVPDTTGTYFPGHTGTTDPVLPFPGFPGAPAPVLGNFGFVAPSILGGFVAMFNDMKFDFGVSPNTGSFGIPPAPPLGQTFLAGVPNTAMAITLGSFPLAGNGMQFVGGTISSFLNITGADASTDNIDGFPTMFGFTDTPLYPAGASTGSLLGGLLTIPVHSSVAQIVNAATPAGPFDYEVVNFDGVIFATLVPEPSTMTLLGLGVVGLLSSAWRARKRKALAA